MRYRYQKINKARFKRRKKRNEAVLAWKKREFKKKNSNSNEGKVLPHYIALPDLALNMGLSSTENLKYNI